MDRKKVEKAVHDLLVAIGENPNRPGLKNTPHRVAKMYEETLSSPNPTYTTFNDEKYDDVVLLKNIEFSSTCEHHLMPFFGVAHVAYVPNGKIAGISKLARVVEKYAKRLQVQERMTQQILDDLVENLETKDVVVYIKAAHTCMIARGVKKMSSETITMKSSGAFTNDDKRRDFHYLISQNES